jgi:hypothetical protein
VRVCDSDGWSTFSDGGCDISRVLERASAVNELARDVATRETHLLLAASIVDVIEGVKICLAGTREITGRSTA